MNVADNRPALPIICGPTGAGKTALAIELAEYFNAEIISADSRQVYRLMDIGTATPSLQEQQRVPHHLVNVAWPDEDFHAARFVSMAEEALKDIFRRQKKAFLVGGTGLYLKAFSEGLLQAPGADQDLRAILHARAEREGSPALHAELAEIDPVSAERLHPNDLIRIVRALEVFEQCGQTLSDLQDEHAFASKLLRTIKIGLSPERKVLYERIDRRAEAMFADGLLEEAEALLMAGYQRNLKALLTIGYRQAFAFLDGTMSREEAIDDLKRSTRRYAKQQLTWFRKDKSIIWLESFDDFVTIRKFIEEFYDI